MPFDPSGIIPVAGALGSAALQQHYALQNWHRTNAYNTPKAQIGRLKEAGLPLATMFGGSGGSTSSAPSTPNVDPTLGTAQGLQSTMLNRMQRKQMELIDNQIYTEQGRGKHEWAEALNSQTNSQRNNAIWQEELRSQGLDTDPSVNEPSSNLVQGMIRDRKTKQASLIGQQISNDLKTIEKDWLPAQKSLAISEILLKNGLTQQQINLHRLDEKIANMLFNQESGSKRLSAFIDALIYKYGVR